MIEQVVPPSVPLIIHKFHSIEDAFLYSKWAVMWDTYFQKYPQMKSWLQKRG